ncbi:holo-[acyl-carrier-protein] synthase [Spiroplasma gladiatoris]|uniref:Holo-[acyl-carrier-protein] synthase n=1 Tax=Spiroplasma gladiatoris TaxID=2143 RepID=A0A4P7AI51_9MOLU|nr:4'-phosphopantetheinyl transferase superfamily protein [Spiroplasma gladiatoris]QBQ07922.1 holo-[acyl-carrier-protein] synthase [Spiroplasma gladiatoris]
MAKIGTDIVQVSRISLETSFLKKVLHQDEFNLLNDIIDLDSKKQFVAGRWAAKEAIFKVLNKNVAFNTISIGYIKNKPVILNNDLNTIEISISHEKEYAIAVALNL